jgi:hypothetical protein
MLDLSGAACSWTRRTGITMSTNSESFLQDCCVIRCCLRFRMKGKRRAGACFSRRPFVLATPKYCHPSTAIPENSWFSTTRSSQHYFSSIAMPKVVFLCLRTVISTKWNSRCSPVVMRKDACDLSIFLRVINNKLPSLLVMCKMNNNVVGVLFDRVNLFRAD